MRGKRRTTRNTTKPFRLIASKITGAFGSFGGGVEIDGVVVLEEKMFEVEASWMRR